jgi:hypothetical protein
MSSITRTALGLAALAWAASPATAAKPSDCFDDLMRGRSAEIVCSMPLIPSPQERAELEKQSRGYVKSAECTVSIRIERALIQAAIDSQEHVFQAPAQPVQCTVTALWDKETKTIPIAATFAPKIVIKGGTATDANPGLANVTGVPRALSWPVEAWVNSGIGIKGNMLKVINAWLDHMRRASVQRQAQR